MAGQCYFTFSFNMLFDLSENKFVSVSEMFHLGWDVNGEAWK